MERLHPMRRYAAPKGAAHDASVAYLLYLHRSPWRWVTYALFFPTYVLLLIGAAAIAGYEPPTTAVLAAGFLATSAAVIGMNAWPYFVVRRLTSSSLAPGATYESAWDDTGFMVSSPTGAEGRIPYSLVKATARKGDWMFLRQTNASMVAIYPRELLPDDFEQRASTARREQGEGRVPTSG